MGLENCQCVKKVKVEDYLRFTFRQFLHSNSNVRDYLFSFLNATNIMNAVIALRSNYQTRWRDIWIYDENKDNLVKMKIRDAE